MFDKSAVPFIINQMPKSKIFYVLLSLVVSVLLVWFLISRIETKDLVQTFSRIYYPALLAYISISLASVWLRAWRYKLLLQPLSISWTNIVLVTLIRNCLDDLLPARIGSLSYIYVLNRRLNFPFENATSSFVIAFVFDFLTLSPFLILAIFVVGLGASTLSSFSLLVLSLLFFLLIFLILWMIIPLARIFCKVYESLLRLFKFTDKKWAKLSSQKLYVTVDSIRDIKERKIFSRVFLLSLFIRLAKYLSVYSLLLSLLQSHGYSLAKLSFFKTILGLTGAELTAAFPVKGIAGFGTWESAWALTFRLMSFDSRLAIISGIGIHLLTNLFEYSLGLLSILILALPFTKRVRDISRL